MTVCLWKTFYVRFLVLCRFALFIVSFNVLLFIVSVLVILSVKVKLT